MKTLNIFLTEKGITTEKFNEMSAEEKAAIFNELNEVNAKAFKALTEDVSATKESIEAAKDELRDLQAKQMETLNDSIREMGLAIKAISEKGQSSDEPTNLFQSIKKGLLENIDKLKAMATGEKHVAKENEFSFKAVGDMLISSNVSGGNVPVEQRLAGMNEIASRQVRLLDLVSRGTASSNVISWVYQANRDGAAGYTAEGGAKNQIDFDLVVASESVKKYTAYIKVSTEMLNDIDFIESAIRMELTGELLRDIESDVYAGAGGASALNGIRTVATAFAAGDFALAIDNANEVDVLTVAANQIAIANQSMPNAILMHPTDVTKLKVAKVTSTDKRYIDRLQMIGGSLSMDGIQIIPTTLVTAGDYLIGDFSKAMVLDKGALSIEVGLDGNDFTKNMRTILAEWRGVCIVKNNDRTAFVKGVFATDKAALETA